MLELKASGSFDNRGFITLFALSIVVAVANLVPPTSRVNWPHLFDQDVGVYLAGIWLLLVAIALVFHGRRGLWLLVGMPVALFWPIFVLLWITGCLDYVGFGFDAILVLYTGFWILIAVIAYMVSRSRGSAIYPSMRTDR